MEKCIDIFPFWQKMPDSRTSVKRWSSTRPENTASTKFGMDRFINGFLDLITINFLTKFGKSPMHLFGLLGTIVFIVGFFLLSS